MNIFVYNTTTLYLYNNDDWLTTVYRIGEASWWISKQIFNFCQQVPTPFNGAPVEGYWSAGRSGVLSVSRLGSRARNYISIILKFNLFLFFIFTNSLLRDSYENCTAWIFMCSKKFIKQTVIVAKYYVMCTFILISIHIIRD